MTEQDDQFKQAVAAFKEGRKSEARDLLMDIVDKSERHEQAWLYLSALVDSVEERQICLENVLEINPNNDRARKGLEKVKQQIAEQKSDDSPAAGATPSEDSTPVAAASEATTESDDAPFSTLGWDSMPAPADESDASSLPIGAEFGSSSGDTLVGDTPVGFPSPDSLAPESTADDDALGWLNDEAAEPSFPTPDQPADLPDAASSDPFAAPGPGRGWDPNDTPTVSDSGQGDDLDSTQEYDDWVQNLNTGDAAAAAGAPEAPAADNLAAPFTEDAPGPFSETDFMRGDDALGTTEPPALAEADSNAGSFGGDVFGGSAEPAWDSAVSSGEDTTTSDDVSLGGFDSPDSGLGATDPADTSDPFSADTMFDDTPGASVDSDSGLETGSLFDDDYAAEDDDLGSDAFASATVYEPDEPLFGEADDDDLNFSFDDDDDSLLDEESAKPAVEAKSAKREKKAKQSKTAPAIDPAHAKYYALIPAEIETKGGSSGNGKVVLGILIMLALNAAGYAAYFLELI